MIRGCTAGSGILAGRVEVIYTSVLPQMYFDNARATAQMVLRAARKTARGAQGRRRGGVTHACLTIRRRDYRIAGSRRWRW
jgi:hypothetical protein